MRKHTINSFVILALLLIGHINPLFSQKANSMDGQDLGTHSYLPYQQIVPVVTQNTYVPLQKGFGHQRLDNRYFLWGLPSTSPPENGYPVLFLFHGAAQHPFSWFIRLNPWSRTQSSFTRLAIANGFFVIVPSSQRPIQPGPRAWDVFTKNITDSSDLQFFMNMLQWLETIDITINLEEIYCAGFSSGAFMTSLIAHVFSKRVSGVVIHSGANPDSIILTDRGPVFNCTKPLQFPLNHPPALIVHGGEDTIVPTACGIHYYEELIRYGLNATLLLDPNGNHIWLSDFNQDIIDWMIKRD
ncbi:MAG: hypothetical protein QCH96_04580 [Candidatus Thermoplasmatota archaeon]|nr:hypothetical protein [Candidatus Thermoplasmatota archaeon]